MAFMLLRATKLRTPVHGSPFLPRAFCISHECSSGSVLNSQNAGPEVGRSGAPRDDDAGFFSLVGMALTLNRACWAQVWPRTAVGSRHCGRGPSVPNLPPEPARGGFGRSAFTGAAVRL